MTASTAVSQLLARWAHLYGHTPVSATVTLAGLALIFASGLLMMFAQLDSFATSVVFWTKMGLIALLLGNGYIRMRAENALRQGLAAGWGRFRRASVASLVLWLVILLAGTLLHSTT